MNSLFRRDYEYKIDDKKVIYVRYDNLTREYVFRYMNTESTEIRIAKNNSNKVVKLGWIGYERTSCYMNTINYNKFIQKRLARVS